MLNNGNCKISLMVNQISVFISNSFQVSYYCAYKFIMEVVYKLLCVPGVVPFIDYDIEPEIFCRFFGFVRTVWYLIVLLKLRLELEIKARACVIASFANACLHLPVHVHWYANTFMKATIPGTHRIDVIYGLTCK
jgi:hypothetical protein